jgi:DNA-binding transcriptional MerR regulator
MPLSRSRDYLSIGEVLESLQADFPDVTISKIRFLETEGLIAPKRTPSGYRMFFEGDLDRLRYVLSLQRDHFLPLKVIRERLAEYDRNGGSAKVTPLQPPPQPAASGNGGAEAPAIDMTGVQMNRKELLKGSGLTEAQLASLEDYGIVSASDEGNYDETVLAAARAAKRFFDYGVEARHLKMYRQFADREVAFFEQIVVPLSRRRDPAAAQEATRSLKELETLARQMREAALRSSLRDLL